MTLTELRYLIALGNERHFGRAAARSFVSQPTLSVAIRKLEDELGVALVERGGGEMRVTAVGERILQQAQRVLDEVAAITTLAQAGADPLEGPLRLGVIFTVGPYLLPQLIGKLRTRAPRMPLLIQENYTSRLAELLQGGELDVVLVALPFEQTGATIQPLYDEPFMAAVPRGHPWERRRSIRGAELAGEGMLMLGTGHCLREQVLQAVPALNQSRENAAAMTRNLEGSSLETLRMMVASGAGVTVMPASATGTPGGRNDLVRYLPFTRPAPKRRIALAWRRSYSRLRAIDLLREAVLSCKLRGMRPVRRASATPGTNTTNSLTPRR